METPVKHVIVCHIISVVRFSSWDGSSKRRANAIAEAGRRAQEYLDLYHGGCGCTPSVTTYFLNGVSSNEDFATSKSKEIRDIKTQMASIENRETIALVIPSVDGFSTDVQSWLTYFATFERIQLVVHEAADRSYTVEMAVILKTIREVLQGKHIESIAHDIIIRAIQSSLNKEM
jgi:hypothetical protein